MSKFEYEQFGYCKGDFDQLVVHAKKYTKEEAVNIFNTEFEYTELEASIDNISEGYAKWSIRPTVYCDSSYTDGLYIFTDKPGYGAFPVWIITLSDLSCRETIKIKPIQATPTLSGKDAENIIKDTMRIPTLEAIEYNKRMLEVRNRITKKDVSHIEAYKQDLITDPIEDVLGQNYISKHTINKEETITLFYEARNRDSEEVFSKRYITSVRLYDDYNYLLNYMRVHPDRIVSVSVDINLHNMFDTLSYADLNNYKIYCNKHYQEKLIELKKYNKKRCDLKTIDQLLLESYIKQIKPAVFRDYELTKHKLNNIKKFKSRINVYYRIYDTNVIKQVNKKEIE